MGVTIHCVKAKNIISVTSIEEYEDIFDSEIYDYPLVAFDNEKAFLGLGEPLFSDGYKSYWGFIEIAKTPFLMRAGSYTYWTLFCNFLETLLKVETALPPLFKDWLKFMSAGETTLGPNTVKTFYGVLRQHKSKVLAATSGLKDFQDSFKELLALFQKADKEKAFLFFN